MTITDEAVQAAASAVEFPIRGMNGLRLALTAALPFLQGVKVKALEWKQEDTRYWRAISVFGVYAINQMREEGFFEMDGDNYANLEAAKAAAQADYDARILSAIEVAPSPRALALEEAAKWLDDWSEKTWGQDVSPEYAAAAIRALSSQPVANGWLPVTTGLNAIGFEIGGGYILKLSYDNLSQFEAAKEAIQSRLPASPGASE